MKDLRDFIALLREREQLAVVDACVDPILEMTEIADRVVKAGGPALLFTNVRGSGFPVLMNQFGTEERMCLALGDVGRIALPAPALRRGQYPSPLDGRSLLAGRVQSTRRRRGEQPDRTLPSAGPAAETIGGKEVGHGGETRGTLPPGAS